MVQQLTFDSAIKVMAVSQDGEYLAISSGYDSSGTSKVSLRRLSDIQFIAEVTRSEREFTSVCFTCGGKILAYSDGVGVQRYDVETGRETDRLLAINVDWMAADKGSRLVTAGTFTQVWDAEQSKKLWQLPGYSTFKFENRCPAVADISPDGNKLAVAGTNTAQVFIYDLEQNAVIQTLNGAPLQADWINWSPDLYYLAVGTYTNGVFLWHLETGEQVLSNEYNSETRGCLSFCFHPSGEYFATGRFTGYITIERVNDGEFLFSEPLHKGRIWTLSFSPDGKKLVSGSEDGVVSILDLNDLI